MIDFWWTPQPFPDRAGHARDAALESVEFNSGAWFDQALAVVRYEIPARWQGSGEDVRHIVASRIGCPHHHNTYGALINQALKRGWLEPTGMETFMRDTQSHKRRTRVYTRSLIQ